MFNAFDIVWQILCGSRKENRLDSIVTMSLGLKPDTALGQL